MERNKIHRYQNTLDMKFRTEYEPRQCNSLINPEETAVLIGSCFADYIGERMRFCRWSAFPNITGTLYNPASIANILRIAITSDNLFEAINESLEQNGELWVSWLADSGFTTYSRQETQDRLLSRLNLLRERLKEARTLIVTFGTAWIYELRERPGYVVSNCHKFPGDNFLRRRLSIKEITDNWNSLLGLLAEHFPNLRIIFTVSPVRHLKDGFEGNSRSKAILQLACEEICGANPRTDYFPSFEIMNDDLRDYRFYSPDMVHPSDMAVDYIWEKFQQRYLSEASRKLLADGEKVTKRLNHRPNIYGGSELARYNASKEEFEASKAYNAFIEAHPTMLCIDE